MALVKGAPPQENTLCRVHRGNLLEDLFCSRGDSGGRMLRAAIQHIEREGSGVVVYIPPDTTLGDEVASFVAARAVDEHEAPVDGSTAHERTLRQFGLGAQVLQDLGISKIRLLTNAPRKLAGLRGYGLEVVECISLND